MRTVGKLRLFAEEVREGRFFDATIDLALPERVPPRSDLRRSNVPLGPVQYSAPPTFPLAFSTAGGDTAAASAAGCPVVVKGHPAHPGTGEMVARAMLRAVARCGLPQGTFSYLPGRAHALGAALVADPAIRAVGFTGSRSGGLALIALAAPLIQGWFARSTRRTSTASPPPLSPPARQRSCRRPVFTRPTPMALLR